MGIIPINKKLFGWTEATRDHYGMPRERRRSTEDVYDDTAIFSKIAIPGSWWASMAEYGIVVITNTVKNPEVAVSRARA